jgi:hypothetical protein
MVFKQPNGPTEAPMRKLIVSCGLLAGALVLVVQSPSQRVRAQEKTTTPPKPRTQSPSTTPSSVKLDPSKEASIRQLMELTGAKGLGGQMMQAGMDQFRSTVTESQPDNPRTKQFIDAFVTTFQKHFDPDSLTERIIPIYDKYLSEEDVKGSAGNRAGVAAGRLLAGPKGRARDPGGPQGRLSGFRVRERR